MKQFKLKVGIDLRRASTLTRKWGTAVIESLAGVLNPREINKVLKQHFMPLFKGYRVINVEILDSITIN